MPTTPTTDDPAAVFFEKIGEASITHWAILANETWNALSAVSALFGIIAMIVGYLNQHSPGHDVHEAVIMQYVGFDMISFGGALVLMRLFAKRKVRLAVRREMAWVQRLPFPVDQYLRFIGASGGYVNVDFEGELPERAEWTQLLGGIDLRPMTLHDDGFADSQKTGYRVSFTSRDIPSARVVRTMWRRVITDVLMAIHTRHPIKSVTPR